MCWNEEVSLNTFIFSAGTLAFVLYNNKYTQYKISYFDNKFLVFFTILVISVQLIEYFLWKSLKAKDKVMNRIWSIVLYVVITLQPIVALMWVTNLNLRNILMTIYVMLYGITFATVPINFETTKHSSGHLQWQSLHFENSFSLETVLHYSRALIWFISFFTGFYYLLEFPWFLLVLITTLLIIVYFYNSKKKLVFNSNWCWFANGVALAAAFYILVILPYREYKTIC